MLRKTPTLGWALFLAFTGMACSSSETPSSNGEGENGGSGSAVTTSGNTSGGGSSGSLSACAGETEVRITDETNYTLSNTMTVAKSTLEDATDLTFDWGSITTDFFGKPIDAAQDLDMVLLSLWHLTPQAIEEALKTDNLSLSLNAGALSAYPDGTFTSENLLDFNLFGEEVSDEDVWAWFDTSTPDYAFPQDEYTFLVMVSEGTLTGKNARMLHMFTLDPNATETTLMLTNDSTKLDYTVDLHSPRAIQIPRATPSIEIDWSDMTVTSLGNEYNPFSVNEAVVAHYPMTREELEDDFLSLEELADGWWSVDDIAGRSVDLGTLAAEDGSPFTGITGDGLWLLALFCTSNCNNPAPISITFLEACP